MSKVNEHYTQNHIRFGIDKTVSKYLSAGIITQKDIDLINTYISWKNATGKHLLSPSRIRNITITLIYWRKYLKVSYTHAKINEIIAAVGEFKKEPMEQNTANTYIVILKGFYYYLKDQKLSKVDKDAIRTIKSPGMNKHTTEPGDILTAEQVRRLLDSTMNPCHKALIAVSWEAGARPSEINTLQWSDAVADEYGYKLMITDSKMGGNTRFARLTFSAPFLSEWEKHTSYKAKDDYIFVNKTGEPFTYGGTACLINRIVKKAGIEKHVTLYSFRKGRINDMIKANVPITAIKGQI